MGRNILPVMFLPSWSKAGLSAIFRPSVLTHAISTIGGVATIGGVVAQPNNRISMAVEHNAEIHHRTDVTGNMLRPMPRHPWLSTVT